MAENEDRVVKIDGKEYNYNDLSDGAKGHLAGLQYAERQIKETNNQLAVLQAARQLYAERLAAELPAES